MGIFGKIDQKIEKRLFLEKLKKKLKRGLFLEIFEECRETPKKGYFYLSQLSGGSERLFLAF